MLIRRTMERKREAATIIQVVLVTTTDNYDIGVASAQGPRGVQDVFGYETVVVSMSKILNKVVCIARGH